MAKQAKPESVSTNKPLICLYRFAALVDRHDKKEATIDFILNDLVEILPGALRFPGQASVRIVMSPFTFESKGFTETALKHVTPIEMFDDKVGTLEVCYSGEVDEAFSGPFTEDEVMLFNYLSRRISRESERLMTRTELEIEKRALSDTNIAMAEVLRRVKDEQAGIGASIQANVSRVIVPLLNNLLLNLKEDQKKNVELINNSLMAITSPYISALSERFMSLTPQEVLICHMIKSGLSSKDIADIRGLSVATVNTHRENIRKKLELSNKKVNLKSFLISNFEDPLKFTSQ